MNVQENYTCSGVVGGSTVFAGSACTSNCFLQDPGRLSTTKVVCGTDGQWIRDASLETCQNVTAVGNYLFTFVSDPRTWPGAFQYAQRFKYKNVTGQLPFVLDASTNAFVQQFAVLSRIWLGATRNGINAIKGVHWATGPLTGTLIYNESLADGGLLDKFYSNFQAFVPEGTNCAVFMRFNGTWFVCLFVCFPRGFNAPTNRSWQECNLQKGHVAVCGYVFAKCV
jgi:hypothetical protein